MNFYQNIILLLVLILSSPNHPKAQSPTLTPSKTYPIAPLPKIRAADVMWHRRIWREIDLTEKINQHLYFYENNVYSKYCLFDIFLYHLNKGTITAFSAIDDQFTEEIPIDKLQILLSDSINGKLTTLNSKDVVKYWLKEDWIYNSKKSKIEVRIVGICPVKIKKGKNGNIIGYQQLFWLYFPHIRGVLVNYEVFKQENKKGNDSGKENERISFDKVFLDRMFNSYIINRSTDKDKHVSKNKTELDVKLELEKSKYYLFNTLSRLWNN